MFYRALTLLLPLLMAGTLLAEEALSPPTSRPNPHYEPLPFAPSLPDKFSWSSGKTEKKLIALTFDDGPHPQHTPALLDILKQYNVKATFFTVGKNVDRYPEIAARIIAEGHEIGNHSYSHGDLSKMSDSEIRTELDRSKDAIRRATGVEPKIMRPPYGGLALFPFQRSWIYTEYQYPTILWSVDPFDWRDRNSALISQRLVAGAHTGAILLAHDIHASTIAAIPDTIFQLQRKGYTFTTVSQMIAQKKNQKPNNDSQD